VKYPTCPACGSGHVLWVMGTAKHVSCSDCGHYGEAEMVDQAPSPFRRLKCESIEFKETGDPNNIAYEIVLKPEVAGFPSKGSREKN